MQVGILVGRSAGGKDFLLQLVRCPDQEGGLPIQISNSDNKSTKKSSSKGKATPAGGKLILDDDWIVEHAVQAARTLPGGLDILGIYVLCDDGTFQASHGILINTLKAIAAELSAGRPSPSTATEQPVPLLALHLDAITAKIAAREVAGAQLRPCEVKTSNILSNMVAVQCSFPVDLKVNLAGGRQRLHEAIRDSIAWQTEHRVAPAVALINNTVQPTDQQVIDVLGNGNTLSLDLLTPLSSPELPRMAVGAAPEVSTSGKGDYKRHAEFTLNGNIDCMAYVNKRESVGAAVVAVKSDVERTLLGRCDVLVEAAEMATAAAQEKHDAAVQKNAKVGGKTPVPPAPKHPLLLRVEEVAAYRPTLPRRAFLDWRQGGCSYCDYVVEGEGVSEAVQRIKEVMGPDSVGASSFRCGEKAAVGAEGSRESKQRQQSSKSKFECNGVTIMATGAAIVAIWISWAFMT